MPTGLRAGQELPLPFAPPDLTSIESSVRDQVEGLHQELEALLESNAPAAELVQSLAGLAAHYAALHFEDTAIDALHNAASLSPDDATWPHVLGVVQTEIRQLDSARESFHRALALEESQSATWTRLGRVELLANRHAEALEAFDRALQLAPDSAAAFEGRGHALVGLSDCESAVGAFRKALELDRAATSPHYPLALCLRQLGQVDAARRHLSQRGERAAQLDDPVFERLGRAVVTANDLVAQATASNQQEQPELALDLYLRALALEPGDLAALRGRASTLVRLGRTQEALDAWRRVLEVDPNSPVGHYNAGLLLLELGDPNAALDHLETSVRYGPDFAGSHLQRAVALAQLRRPDEARGALLQAISIGDHRPAEAPAVAEAHLLLCQLLLTPSGSTERATTAQALEHARRAAELDPDRREAHDLAARLSAQAGRFDQAVDHYRELIRLGDPEGEAAFGGALALLFGDRESDARRWLEEALARQPGAAHLRHLLARLLATAADDSARDAERALALARSSFESQPGVESAETLAMALAESGRFREAVQVQSQVVERVTQQGTPPAAVLRRLDDYRASRPCRQPWKP